MLAFVTFGLFAMHAQTLPCSCLDGSGDEVVTNTDFISQVLTYGWGDSIPSDSGVEPGMCDLDGDGTRNVHDFILFTSVQNQYCQAQGGEEVLTLVDTIPPLSRMGLGACGRPRCGPWRHSSGSQDVPFVCGFCGAPRE